MSRFLSYWKEDLASKVPLALWLVLTVIVGLAGPFGTDERLLLWQRLAFWGAVIGVSILISTGVRSFVHTVLSMTDFVRSTGMIAALMAAILTWPIHFIATLLMGAGSPRLLGPARMAAFIACVSVGVGIFRAVLRNAAQEPARPEPDDAPTLSESGQALPRLMDRLPAQAQGPLISISGRNHYVDVVTGSGRTSVLMRFADALDETAPTDGIQIHRSHWVAADAIRGIIREGAKIWVDVDGGARLPVSRNHRAKLEVRGLL